MLLYAMQRTLFVLNMLYGILITVVIAIRLAFGDISGWVSLFSSLVPASCVLVLPCFVWSAVKRHVFGLLSSATAVVTLVCWYGPRFMPKNIPSSAHLGVKIKVLSHNVGQDLPDYDHITRVIRESGADVVLLQEVTNDFIQRHWPQLQTTYPFQVHGPLLSQKMVGMGVLSRYPLHNPENFKLDQQGLVFQQRVEIELDHTSIAVYNIHTTFPWLYWRTSTVLPAASIPSYEDLVRRREIQGLALLLSREARPFIVAGDFNLSDFSGDYQSLASYAVDSYAECGYGFGFTWPANRTPSVNIPVHVPLVRLDYVFHARSLRGVSASVLPATGSDHRPLLAELVFV